MADIDRLVPNTVGVLDAHDQFRRFSMHVGADVTASFSQAEAGTKSQTNISGGGYRDGERVNISASLKGRIWSHAAAQSLKHWRDWCDSIGDKLLDDSTQHRKGHRPVHPARSRSPAARPARCSPSNGPGSSTCSRPTACGSPTKGKVYEAAYTDLVPDTDPDGDTFRFTVKTGALGGDLRGHGRERAPALPLHETETDVSVVRPRSEQPLSEWLNENGLLFVLDEDRIIEHDLIYKPTWDRPPFDTKRAHTTRLVRHEHQSRVPDEGEAQGVDPVPSDHRDQDRALGRHPRRRRFRGDRRHRRAAHRRGRPSRPPGSLQVLPRRHAGSP